MRKARYICKRCGNEFEIELVTQEEARDREIAIVPVTCPKCGTEQVEEAKKYY